MKRNSTILGSVTEADGRCAASPQKMQGKLLRAFAVCAATTVTITLSACGQKGPLYLPSPQTGAPSTSVAPDAK